MHWCTDEMLVQAFTELECLDLRAEKVKLTRTLREALWKRRTTSVEDGKTFLWGAPVVTASVIEVQGCLPLKEVWPSRAVVPFVRIRKRGLTSNFSTTPEGNIRRSRVHTLS